MNHSKVNLLSFSKQNLIAGPSQKHHFGDRFNGNISSSRATLYQARAWVSPGGGVEGVLPYSLSRGGVLLGSRKSYSLPE